MDNNARIARQIQVHFFIFASIDLPLFLPKKVSLEPPSASMPEELLGCISTKIIAASATTVIIMMSAIQMPL